MDNNLKDLISAAEYAQNLISKIPAFGDGIGSHISKAQLGIANNALSIALANYAYCKRCGHDVPEHSCEDVMEQSAKRAEQWDEQKEAIARSIKP